MRQWAKILRITATTGVLVFVAQLFFAIAGDWVPQQVLGHVSYPIYLGVGPWTVECLGLNISILVSSLGALYLADILAREADGMEPEAWREQLRRVGRRAFIKEL